ncbi:hypothetical protein EVG20_g2567 [Dentipellis fragilis]|uniref:Uncharacterized protein n=1 Tax=Dentipellis fragilis TaxID=205917 RepID=A0A4Y9Z7D8_9AGAM|nr:hypothetical protein EVG20_g2567 [Dentipellis fragilis]
MYTCGRTDSWLAASTVGWMIAMVGKKDADRWQDGNKTVHVLESESASCSLQYTATMATQDTDSACIYCQCPTHSSTPASYVPRPSLLHHLVPEPSLASQSPLLSRKPFTSIRRGRIASFYVFVEGLRAALGPAAQPLAACIPPTGLTRPGVELHIQLELDIRHGHPIASNSALPSSPVVKVKHEGTKHSSKPSASLAPTTPLPMPSDRTATTSIALYAAYASPSSGSFRSVFATTEIANSHEADYNTFVEAKINHVKINRLSQGVSEGLQIGYSDALGGVPAIVVEMALYGINLSLSIATAIVLLRRSTGEGLVHRWFLIMLITMFIVATAHIALSIVEVYQGATSNFFDEEFPKRWTLARQFLLLIQAALGDSVTIWRCYNVFGRSIIVVVLPALTALASFVLGLYLAGISTQVSSLLNDPWEVRWAWLMRSWIWATITMVCTVYCACAISYKIYSSARLTKSSNLFAVIFFVVETSLIYTVAVVIYVAIALHESINSQSIVMGIIVQLPPIVLCLLLLQTRFYNSGNQAVRYMNPEPARPWDAVRRIFRTNREACDMSTFRVASVAIHKSTHTISTPADAPSTNTVDDIPDEDAPESDAIEQRVKKVSDLLDIA